MSGDERHACPRCGALGPCEPRRCADRHECAECGKTWLHYSLADLGREI